jgi:hypothetical protein
MNKTRRPTGGDWGWLGNAKPGANQHEAEGLTPRLG